VFVLHSLERVSAEDEITEKNLSAIDLYLAENEYESFQIGILNKEECEVEFIFTKNLTPYVKIYQEYFISIKTPSYSCGRSKPERKEKFPDPLVPVDNKIPLKKGINIFWVDFYSDENISVDSLVGEIKIKISPPQLNFEIPVKVHILPITLPKIPSFNSLFVFWLYPIIEKHQPVNPYLITRLYYEELLKHKINPSAIPLDIRPKRKALNTIMENNQKQVPLDLYTADFNVVYPTGRLEDNVEYYRAKKLNLIEVPLFAQQGLLAFQWLEYLKIFSSYFKEKGFSEIIDYSFDEPHPQHYDLIREWAYHLHKFTAIKNLVTFNNFYSSNVDERLLDDGSGRSAIDIWVPKLALHYYFQNFFSERQKKGEEVWPYQAGVTDSFTPKWLLDYPLIEWRIVPWIAFLFDIKGMVYWGVDKWEQDVWEDPTVIIDNKVYNGDGYLFYYGSKLGMDKPIPSIRLKVLRDGIEDYEYLKILKSLDYLSYITLVKKIARNWDDWCNKSDSLILVRKEIGEKIKTILKEERLSEKEEPDVHFNKKEKNEKGEKIFDIKGNRIFNKKMVKKGIYFIRNFSNSWLKVVKIM